MGTPAHGFRPDQLHDRNIADLSLRAEPVGWILRQRLSQKRLSDLMEPLVSY